ncbi:hypothetical protein FQA39_LY07676 [Lamprigera yunnana]|nr:hypothetical protein FQA39_LY07676 [Lamprigera yunnana]
MALLSWVTVKGIPNVAEPGLENEKVEEISAFAEAEPPLESTPLPTKVPLPEMVYRQILQNTEQKKKELELKEFELKIRFVEARNKEKEVALKEKEVALKEKEVALKEMYNM